MANETKIELIKASIEQLDSERKAALEAQERATGNQHEVFTAVASRAVAEGEYLRKRKTLVGMLDDAIGVSPAVEAFLNPGKPIETKFDLDSGKTKIDTSLQPLGGKAV